VDQVKLLLRGLVLRATSAEQTLRLCTGPDRQVGLLVAEVTLPTSSGIQVALVLRSEIPGLPVILISEHPVSGWSARESADLERLGAISVVILQRPFQPQVVLNAVRELLGTPQPDEGRPAWLKMARTEITRWLDAILTETGKPLVRPVRLEQV
jgi:FixJ family two-component response regulator